MITVPARDNVKLYFDRAKGERASERTRVSVIKRVNVGTLEDGKNLFISIVSQKLFSSSSSSLTLVWKKKTCET